MSDKTIKLPCFGIVVELTEIELHSLTPNRYNGGSITSDLHENPDDSDMEDENDIYNYNNSMDGIESMILGHACAGIDIESPAYIEGIESAVQACADNI
jgi:uncharacterized membrane protein YkgB